MTFIVSQTYFTSGTHTAYIAYHMTYTFVISLCEIIIMIVLEMGTQTNTRTHKRTHTHSRTYIHIVI